MIGIKIALTEITKSLDTLCLNDSGGFKERFSYQVLIASYNYNI